MATNVTLSVSNPVVNVSTTTDTVNVSTNTSNIVVGTTPTTSNTDIRVALGNIDPVLYDSSTGVFSLNNTTLLSGQTTDNLTEGTNNIYFSTSGAAVNTDNLPEGTTNKYLTNASVEAVIANTITASANTTANIADVIAFQPNSQITFSVLGVRGQFRGGGPISYDSSQGQFGLNTDWGVFGPIRGLEANGSFYVRTDAAVGGDLEFLASNTSNSQPLTIESTLSNTISSNLDINAGNIHLTPKGGGWSGGAILQVRGTAVDSGVYLGNESSSNVWLTNGTDVRLTGYTVPESPFHIESTSGNVRVNSLTVAANAGLSRAGNLTAISSDITLDSTNDLGIRSAGANVNINGTQIHIGADQNASNGFRGNVITKSNIKIDGYHTSTGDETRVHFANATSATSTLTFTNTTVLGFSSDSVSPPSGTFIVNGEGSITGNLVVGGNIDYTHTNDLYVANSEIVMNANAATDVNVTIVANRPVAGSNAFIRWDETADNWIINDGSNSYVIPRSTSDLAEGTNLYYTDSRFDTRFATKTTDDLTEGSANLYYTDARSNSAMDAYLSGGYGITYTSGVIETTNADIIATVNSHLVDGGTRKDANNLRVQDLSISSDASAGSLSYYFPNSQPATGDFLEATGTTQLGFASFTTRSNSAIGAYQGDINTTGNITAAYFSGDGSGLTGVTSDVETESVTRTVKADEDLAVGDAVAITGGTGDNPNVSKALASNASLMPAFGIMLEAVTATNTGNCLLYGEHTSIDMGTFPVGDEIFISASTAGALSNVAPTGEANLLQKIGKVVKTGSGGKLTVQGAGRTNATPNLDDGAIFAGNSTNQAVAVDTTTNFDVSDTEFDLANALSNVNSIESESGSNITLDTAGGTGINFTKTQGATADTLGLTVNPGGYGASIKSSDPTYSGTGNITTFVCRGNVTSGSPNVVISSAIELNAQSGASTDFGNASTLSDFMSYASANMVFRTGGIYSYALTPFPNGTRISSVDAANNIITMNNNALADFEYKDTTGLSFPWARAGRNQLLLVGQGAYDDDTGLIEHYYSEYDFGVSADRNTLIQDQDFWYPNFYNPVVPFLGGYGNTGPTVADITTSFGDEANLSIGQHALIQRTNLSANSTFAELDHGLVFGGATPTRRMIEDVSDINPIPGIQMLYSGNDVWNNQFINSGSSGDWPGGVYSQPQLQLGLKQFTDNSAQNASPQIGPRIFFSSAKGKLSDSELTHYPRAGQEIGRITWWGTHGDNTAPAQNSPPAYMSVQASDDWTAGSNSSMYFTGTSNWQGVNTNDLWLAYERGNVILASGQNSSDVSKNAGITFAPAKAVGNNPKDIYTFDGKTSTTTQDAKFATVNYANVSANSGAHFSITHGDSAGAGTVGDQDLSFKRNDNTVTETFDFTLNRGFTPGDWGDPGNSADVIRINSANHAQAPGKQLTFANVSDGNWTYLNGNTYVVRAEGSNYYSIYDSSNTTPIAQAGATVYSMTGDMSNTNVFASGVTEYEYKFTMPEQESNLYLKANTVTTVKFTGSDEVNFSAVPVVPSKTVAELANTTATAGGVAFCSDETGGAVLAFADGTSWRRSTDRANVS